MNTTGTSNPAPMWCNRCGERFTRERDAYGHICSPNLTGFHPGDTVRAGDAVGQIRRVSRGLAEVYFRSSFRSHWWPASELVHVDTS